MAQATNYLHRLGLPGLVLGLLAVSGCEDDLNFAGDGKLTGVLYFENLSSGKVDTAYNAEVKLYPKNKPESAIIIKAPRGTFEVINLDKDTYTLEARLDQRPPSSSSAIVYRYAAQDLSLDKDEQLLDQKFTLKADETTITEPGVQVTVVDASGSVRPGARVCLYTDQAVLSQNFRKCTGSLRSGLTNSRGVILFTGLQARTYYAGVLAPNGRDSLTNVSGTQTLSIGPLPTAGVMLNSITVTQSSIPSTTVAPGLRLTIVDANNIVLPAARVCLYPALSFLTASGLECTTSLRSDSTNVQGQVTFTSLQPGVTYYVKAVKLLGTNTLTNLGTGAVRAVTTDPQGVKAYTIPVQP